MIVVYHMNVIIFFSEMLSGWIPVRRLGSKERVQHSGDTAGISIGTGDR